MDMKPWWQSVGVWGGLIATLGGLAGLVGYNVTPADQAIMAESAVRLAEAISSIVATIGGIVAIYGRLRASKAIGKP